MATYSTYKNLEKPLSTEKYNVGVANKNVDIIDSEFHKLDLKNESQDNLLATKESLNNEINRAITSETVLNDNFSALITELTTRLNVLADSDDTTLDQLSEIVAYIKNNKDLIDSITTNKINVSDIIDTLTSTAIDKPLSANQGKILEDKKVDKVSGKGLSTNDYTTAEKDKLSGIAPCAEVNIQSDWDETDETSSAFIKNKPTYSEATTNSNGLMSKFDKAKLDSTNIAYATCTTTAETSEKEITISENLNWSLKAGAIICVKYTNTNTASNCTLNVHGTGAKQVWYNNAVNTGNSNMVFGYANRHICYIYDGTYWVWMGHSLDNNTTYSNVSLGQGYGTCTTAAATTAKAVTLSSYALVTGGIVAVKFTYSVPASATMNINSKGAKAIYYKGAAISGGVINAGNTATFMYNGSQYHLLAVDSNTSTNDTSITYSDSEPATLTSGMTWIGN